MRFSHLLPHLPSEESFILVNTWTHKYSLDIILSKDRKRKLGDYRKGGLFSKHRISINYNLDKELFFLTLTHEIAHLLTYSNYKFKRISPHGKEWKLVFGNLILDSLSVYSTELQSILIKFAQNPKAGYYSDTRIVEYFTLKNQKDKTLLKHLSPGSLFYIEKNAYQFIEKKRTRYLCKNILNQKKYLINGWVEVKET